MESKSLTNYMEQSVRQTEHRVEKTKENSRTERESVWVMQMGNMCKEQTHAQETERDGK